VHLDSNKVFPVLAPWAPCAATGNGRVPRLAREIKMLAANNELPRMRVQPKR
jgi:hypothetical protein